MNYTSNFNLYKWNVSDIKQDTINEMSSAMDKIDSSLADNARLLGLNVTIYGAVGDGVTQCDTALTNAISVAKNKKLYFPQNDSNNAVYYFNGNPFSNGALDGYEIISGEGVVLSVSTLNGQPLRNVEFGNFIQIYVRDRDNYAKGFPLPDDMLAASFTNNEMDLGLKFPTVIADNDGVILKENLKGDGTLDSSNYILTDPNTTYAHGFYIDSTVNAVDNAGMYHVLGMNSKPGVLFSNSFFSLGYESSYSVRLGVAAWKDERNFALVTLDLDKIYFGKINLDNGSGWTESNILTISSKFTNAYGLRGRGFNMAIRQIKNNSFDVLLNGVFIGTFTTPFNIAKIGGCINHFNADNTHGTSGIRNWYLMNPMFETMPKGFIGDSLKIATFGDSITHTEGSPISWANYLSKMLTGQRGITSVTVNNSAHSGDRSDQQLAVMQSFDFTGYDTVCILIGTNDILQGININTFKNNIQSMINIASPSTRKVILGIPPLWTTRDLTGKGVQVSNWDQGINYRECIKYTAIQNGCYIAECDYDIGRVGIDNSTDLLRDNLHPNTIGEVLISKSFARSIIKSHTNDVSALDVIYGSYVIEPVYQNGWSNFNSSYKTTIEKEANGKITISGVIKAPSLPLTGGQLIFNLPNGFRPRKNLIVPALNTSSGNQSPLTFDLASNGNFSVNSGSSLSASDFISFSTSFLSQ